jgi:hypothetical protein
LERAARRQRIRAYRLLAADGWKAYFPRKSFPDILAHD